MNNAEHDPDSLIDNYRPDAVDPEDDPLADLRGIKGPTADRKREAYRKLESAGTITERELESRVSMSGYVTPPEVWFIHRSWTSGVVPWLRRERDDVTVSGGVTVDAPASFTAPHPRSRVGARPTDALKEAAVELTLDNFSLSDRLMESVADWLVTMYVRLAADETPWAVLEPLLCGYVRPGKSLLDRNVNTKRPAYRTSEGLYIEDRDEVYWGVGDKTYWNVFPQLPGVSGVDPGTELTFEHERVAVDAEETAEVSADAD